MLFAVPRPLRMIACRWRQTLRQQFDAVLVAHQRLGMAEPLQRVVVADVGHHQFMADIARAVVEQQALFEFVNLRIEIPVDGELRGGSAEVRDSWRGLTCSMVFRQK